MSISDTEQKILALKRSALGLLGPRCESPLSSEHINNTTALINPRMQQLHELILH